ncbi:hypothetical protein, partial [Bacillus mycoides]|uniref:hypothetical protein n=1 Tax=Bacillus mycoides TaxID=1405 RepID=UPI0019D52255
SCRVKERKAQKECKQRGIGKRKSEHVASCRVKEKKQQNLLIICYNKLNIIVVKIFMMKTTLL